jgi:hypothetical protein
LTIGGRFTTEATESTEGGRRKGSNGVESKLLTIGGRFTTEATESTEGGRRKAATVGSMES